MRIPHIGPMQTTNHENRASNRKPWKSMGRGVLRRCPRCGIGKLFHRYLKVADACPHCAEELHHHRADDAPAYLTILLVGHLLFPPIFLIERFHAPPLWMQFAIWGPLLCILTLGLLPMVKGAVVNLQWALRMHGFGNAPSAGKPPDDET